jgi:voltage-gated sodium channel
MGRNSTVADGHRHSALLSARNESCRFASSELNEVPEEENSEGDNDAEDKWAQLCASAPTRRVSEEDLDADGIGLLAGAVSTDDKKSRSPIRQVEEELQRLRTKPGAHRGCSQFSSSIRTNLKSISSPGWIRTNTANYVFGFVITLNAIYLGFETDWNRPESKGQFSKRFWLICESGFLVIFTMELALRFRADGVALFKDPWGVFDFTVVFFGISDTWVLSLALPQDEFGSDFQSLSLLRLGRLIRFARVLRIVRLLRFVRELLLLVKGMLGAMKALIWAFLLIVMVLYISAVFVTEIIRGELKTAKPSEEQNLKLWFGSVGSSILSLAQLMTLEGWPTIVRFTAIEGDRKWLLLFFLPFLCCTNFALLNVVTAIMVENVFAFAEEEKSNDVKRGHRHRKAAIQKVAKLFRRIDIDNSDSLTPTEVKDALKDSSIQKQFQELGMAKHDVDTLFQCLDVDGNGELSMEEFCEGCLRIIGDASAPDLLRVQHDVQRARKRFDVKKITRHMVLAAWCLQNDYDTALAKTTEHAQQQPRKAVRAKTLSESVGTKVQENDKPVDTSAQAAPTQQCRPRRFSRPSLPHQTSCRDAAACS